LIVISFRIKLLIFERLFIPYIEGAWMMKELSKLEIVEVSGGFFFAPFLWGTIIGLGSYMANKAVHKELMTYEGAAIAATFGGVTGGVGGAAAGATGGGIVGNLVWRPGFVAINSAGQAIAQEH